MTSSVFSGRISLTERTSVVLPTPNPPTTTIFRPVSAASASGVRWAGSSQLPETMEHLLQQFGVGGSAREADTRGWRAVIRP
ncbi:hypothetical protein SBADM41S_08093 [Streptomyces badius]